MTRPSRAMALIAAFALSALVAAAADDRADVVYGNHVAGTQPTAGSGAGPLTAVAVLALAGAGAWLYLKGRDLKLPGRAPRKLLIDETRSLGSRQYLVVASYEGKKVLLGVCPGRIDLLTHLESAPGASKAE